MLSAAGQRARRNSVGRPGLVIDGVDVNLTPGMSLSVEKKIGSAVPLITCEARLGGMGERRCESARLRFWAFMTVRVDNLPPLKTTNSHEDNQHEVSVLLEQCKYIFG